MTREGTLITSREFADILERNGFLTAANDVREGRNWRDSTAYCLHAPLSYRDNEGLWLNEFLAALHS